MKNQKIECRFYDRGSTYYLLLSLFLISTICQGQTPGQFSYQGIARGTDGKIIQNQTIRLRLTVYEKLAAEAVPTTQVFQEVQDAQTNGSGVFNVAVGSVTPGLQLLDWQSTDKTFFLGVEFDPLGGNAFTDLGKTQLLTVPYSMFAQQAGKWADYKPIIQKGPYSEFGNTYDPIGQVGKGERLIWHPGKGAFRVGFSVGDAWDENNIGQASFSAGTGTEASGSSSTAIGYDTKAKGAMSFTSGYLSRANGDYSFACGVSTIANADQSSVFGMFNDISDIPSAALTDRLFQIGNGSQNSRTNALTILRNGNVGIGSNVLAPEFLLDLGGRARVKHNPGLTAGIHFNNSQNNVDGFVGMRADGEVGFYVSDIWAFWVNGQGEGRLNGALIQTSDRRLKKDITKFTGSSLSQLSKISGYHFKWDDSRKDQGIQTGLIAQEVEAYFPELVKTDDKGFKSVNYIGMIPHLIESAKELRARTDEIVALRKEVDELKSYSDRIEKLEAALNARESENTRSSKKSEVR